MTTEERVWAYLVEANPIPDYEAQRTDQVDVAAYLDTLEERSSDMTQLDTAKATRPSKRKAVKTALAAAAAVIVVAAVGVFLTQTDDPDAAAAADFVGVWQSNDGVYIQFNEDGTLTGAFELDDLPAGPLERGTWSFDGTEFTWIDNEDNPTCAGQVSRYSVQFLEEGSAKWTPIGQDPCVERGNDLSRGPMRPRSP